jgi:hypothetical protein
VFADHPDKDSIVNDISRRDTAGSKGTNATYTLLQDPVFEAAWDDMPHDEQLEFPEMRKEKTRGRVRRHMASKRENERHARPAKRRRTRGNEALAPAHGNEPLAPAQGVMRVDDAQDEPPLAPGVHDAQDEQPLAPAQGNIIGDVDRVCRPREVPGVPRGQPWGRVIDDRPMFVLARTHQRGALKAITVTCNLHRRGGGRCNKSLSLGTHFSEEEAMRRVKAWCVAGLTLPDEDWARQHHMDPVFFNPRTVPEGELNSIDELDALVGA